MWQRGRALHRLGSAQEEGLRGYSGGGKQNTDGADAGDSTFPMKCLQTVGRKENGGACEGLGQDKKTRLRNGSEGPPKAQGCERGPNSGDR